MALQQFTNLNFEDIKSSIKDYVRENSNFTDMDFEGSNLSILINLLAYNSYSTAYNTNMVVNETFIDSATLRENVVFSAVTKRWSKKHHHQCSRRVPGLEWVRRR